MSYLEFIVLLIVPATLFPLALAARQWSALPDGSIASVLVLVGVALAYTIPWDRHLIHTEVWGYPPERVIATLFDIPVEELLFMILQTIAVGSWTLYILAHEKLRPDLPSHYETRLPYERFRWIGIGIALQVSLFGILLLQIETARYLGLLLAWAGPVLLLQFCVGGHLLRQHPQTWLLGILPPFFYLCLADRLAIHFGIWHFSEQFTSGILILGLPLEEMLFFLLTSMMVNQGVLLYTAILKLWTENAPERSPALRRMVGGHVK